MAFDIQAYFTRIGFKGVAAPTLETLQRIHLLHTCSIPFENLDVLLGRTIDIEEDKVFEKLIVAGRGGYCYEQNALLRAALLEIGFEVVDLAARVLISEPSEIPPRTHRLLLVTINQQCFIADVGFGGKTLTGPLRLETEVEQSTPHGVYRLTHLDGDDLLSFKRQEGWMPLYRFDLQQQYFSDFQVANHYVSTWPDSHFRHHLMVCLHNADGTTMTLNDRSFNDGQQRLETADEATLYAILQDVFGLSLKHTQHGISFDEFAAICPK